MTLVPDLVGWGMLVLVAGSAVIGAGRRIVARRRARRVLRERPDLGRGSQDGSDVRVTGVVRALEPLLEAPLSGRTCVVYWSRVDATNWLVRGAARSGAHESLEIVPFLIDRGAEGTVLVDGSHAILDLAPIKLPVDRARREQFLLRHGVSLKEVSRANYEEVLVEPGQTVTVAGLMMMDPAAAPVADERGFRDAPPASLRLTGNTDHPVVIGKPD